MKKLAAALALLTLAAAPAQASTLPPLDFKAGDKILAAGFPDLNLDFAVSDRLALGYTLLFFPPILQWSPSYTQPNGTVVPAAYPFWVATGPRATYRLLGDADGSNLGASVGGGIMGPQFGWWLQPALVGTLSFWGVVRLRGSAGPVFSPGFDATNAQMWLWPNVELGIRITDRHELTFGGNALVGWRGKF